ncbi:phosphoribosylaminoimidazolesuccinocarboxamide synthase [Salsuginibacillus kocurii]|uniref:phosphoribosylaminoimidazolesuccinocarboxamide synthase n=1 Tax=Salsuginibacillus kocurii TaxID=427078 RepID=UPI00036632DA|nr:phosphoribosylaminoimidazolesuccinocarboxamide synthase [Salsuginibacillus kocurii]
MGADGLLYEGKAKKLFQTENPNVLRVEYKDEATAFNGEKMDEVAGKARLNNELSALFFAKMNAAGLPTHFIERTSSTEQLVKKTRILPLEVVVRNIVAGSLQRRTGIAEGRELTQPIVEYYYKDDELGDPLLNEDHIRLVEAATPPELKQMRELALQTNEALTAAVRAAGLLLVDFKLEFGLTEDGELVVSDEISPDTCRFWDEQTREKLDKDVYRYGLGELTDTYEQILERMGGSVS